MIVRDSIVKRLTSVIYVVRDRVLELNVAGAELNQYVSSPEVSLQGDAAVVSSMANQFQMVMNPIRVQFTDKSEEMPARGDFAARVVGLADYMARTNGLVYSAGGLNLDITFRLEAGDRASQVILDRFVDTESFASTGYGLSGASVRLWYVANGVRHYLYVEPEGNSYSTLIFHAHVNVHYDQLDAITSNWLATALQEEYEDFMRVLSNILSN